MKVRRNILQGSLMALATSVQAQVAQQCITTDVCYGLNIPSSTASSGTGDIFFSISAPSTYEWVALGQGSGMAGSNIFAVYVSSSGTNVTLSPRSGTGHTMPDFNSDAQVTLLEGSGVTNGKMVANVRCSNCASWSGGSMDFKADSASWIYAYHTSGGPKKSDDQSASINQHNAAKGFTWSFANAKGGSSVNPLLNTAASASGSGGAASSCIPSPTSGSAASAAATASGVDAVVSSFSTWPSAVPTQFGSSFPSQLPSQWRTQWPSTRPTNTASAEKRQSVNYCTDSSGQNGNGNGVQFINQGRTPQQKMLIAHGTLAALAFVVFFPSGAMIIRFASFPGTVWLHAFWQIFSFLAFTAAVGLGIKLSLDFELLDNYHPIIGLLVFAMLFFQPFLGYIHHVLFKKTGGRTLSSHVHLWIGRIIITLGIVNGGLGFRLAKTTGTYSRTGLIVYCVIGSLAWLGMMSAAVYGEVRRRKTVVGATRTIGDEPPKYHDTANGVPQNGPVTSEAQGYYGR